ncbi:MAG: coenzyme F420 hydrogenase/dehydrogenase beta subunit N-terminal domain-containing protein, partial [Promethearchaeota archaeon]
MEKIKKILSQDRCSGCGMCVALCPTEAIQLKVNKNGFYRPLLNADRCNNCNICDEICPSVKVRYAKKGKNEDDVLGSYFNIYYGYSKNETIRKNGASGGICTQLLINLLNEKIVDRVIITGDTSNNVFSPRAKETDSEDIILRSAKSKYIQVDFTSTLKSALRSNKKIAIVGLPCLIYSLKNVQKLEIIKAKILFTIELLCGRIASNLLLKYYLKSKGIYGSNFRVIYRYGDWWNHEIAVFKNKRLLVKEDFRESLFGKPFINYLFTQTQCLKCKIQAGFSGDIVLGNYWLKEYSNCNNPGINIIIS